MNNLTLKEWLALLVGIGAIGVLIASVAMASTGNLLSDRSDFPGRRQGGGTHWVDLTNQASEWLHTPQILNPFNPLFFRRCPVEP